MAPCDVKVCRICFAMDCELHVLHENIKLYKGYEAVTGLILANEEGLPPYLCTNCADQQTNYVHFMNKSLQAHLMLLDILKNHGHISAESIQAVIKTNQCGSDIVRTEQTTFSNFKIEIKHEVITEDPIVTELNDELKIEFNPDDALVRDEATVAPCVVETNDIIVKEEVFDEASVNDYLDDGQSNGGSKRDGEYESGASEPSIKKKLCAGIVHQKVVTTRQGFELSEIQSTDNGSRRLNRAPKTPSERAREYRARKALHKQSKQQHVSDAIVEIALDDIRSAGPLEDGQVPGRLQISTVDTESLQRQHGDGERKEGGCESSKKQAKTAAQRMREYRARQKKKRKQCAFDINGVKLTL